MKDPIPYWDANYEIWCCNAMWRKGFDQEGRFRADRWFELHPPEVQTTQELEWIRTCPIPLYVWPGWNSILAPTHVVYPLRWVCEEIFTWGNRPQAYFTNTFALQVALAIKEGFKLIYLADIWLEQGRELCVERACLEFWLGVARGRGIEVYLSRNCPILQHPFMYGRDYVEEKAEVEARLRMILPSIAHDGYAGSR